MSLARELKKAAGGAEIIPLATDLDGVSDSLERSSDFTGNADGKTFTFSGWVYAGDASTANTFFTNNIAGSSVGIYMTLFSNILRCQGRNAAGTLILDFELPSAFSRSKETFVTYQISIDLANASNRYVFVNDIDQTSNVVWTTYTNDNINFTEPEFSIGERGGGFAFCRYADMFLDYTYRDLSMSANRRLFTTIDSEQGLISVGGNSLASLNPIFTAFTDPDDLTLNQGTGGAWTVNGIMDRSQRGVNQFNAVASEFDGSADYLELAGSPAADSKQFFCKFSVKPEILTDRDIINISSGTSFNNVRFRVGTSQSGSNISLSVVGYTAAGTLILSATSILVATELAVGRNISVAMTGDMSDSGTFKVFVGGSQVSTSVSTYTDASLEFSTATKTRIASDQNVTRTQAAIGDLIFNSSIESDLSIFFDDSGRPLFVDDNTYPIQADILSSNAGLNRGTLSDFTVNSGPFVGARGLSEYWARSSSFDAASESLRRIGAFNGTGARGVATLMFSFARDATIGTETLLVQTNTAVTQFRGFEITTVGTTLDIELYNNSNVKILDVNQTSAFTSAGEWVNVILWFDLSNASNRGMVINNVVKTPSWTTYTNDTFDISTSDQNTYLGVQQLGSSEFDGDIGNFIWWDQYIDLSAEADRLKYFDGLGNPIDIQPAIDSGDIQQPMVYLRMDDTGDLGLDSSTNANNFTMEGTVSAGADVNA